MGERKVAKLLTTQDMIEGHLDTQTLKEAVNEDKMVTSRLGVEYASVPMASRLLVENGLLGATPFSTYAAMTASALVDGDYAVVSNDPTTIRNGIYEKVSGSWVYSKYNNFVGTKIESQITALPILSKNNASFALGANNLNLQWGVVDTDNNIGVGLDDYANLITTGGQFESLVDNDKDYSYAVLDADDNIAFGVKKDGTFDMPNNAPSGSVAIDNGDIYYINGNNSKQLTSDGGNQAPSFLNSKSVKFVSNKRGGFAEYAVDIDGTNERLLYASRRGYEQILITGQSLAEGADIAITTTPPYPSSAYMFENGAVGRGNTLAKPNLKPLAESGHESIGTGFANKLLSDGSQGRLLVSGQAWGGASYAKIKKDGGYNTYSQVMQQVKFGSALNKGSAVRAVFMIHGEQDGLDGNTNYDANLRELLNDYNTDIKAANGQIDNVVMLLCQTSSMSGYRTEATRSTFVTPFLQLKATQDNADMFLVCPKYFFDYIDHAHINSTSTRTLGEYYAKVYRQVVIEGKPWKPLQPNNISSVANTLVIDFDVPKPPLVIDTTKVLEGADNLHKGFVLKNSGAVTITDVVKTGDAQVTITLSAPVPTGAILSYAFDNGTHQKSGREQGARGNIRDSDTTPSAYTSQALHNWCVTFKHTF
ncbi:MAG: sialate O-acetylesterase [Psychrobacter sp.]